MSGSLAASFRLQSTIVQALILQDMSARYARTRLGALTALFEPVMVVIGTYVIRFYIQGAHSIGGIPMVLFIVTGFMTDFCFRIVTGNVMSSADRKAPSRMFPQVTSLDVVIARAISGTTVSAGAMVITFIIASLMTGRAPSDVLYCLIAASLTFTLAIATGLMVGVILRRYPVMRVFVGALLRINFVLSGAAFLGTEFPRQYLGYISWNPTFHVVEMMREGWFRGYVSPVANPIYVLACIAGLLSIGMPLERLTRRDLAR